MTKGFHIKNGITHIDQVSLTEIAKEHGTPAYVYSASVIRRQHDQLRDALEKALPADRQPLLCYACKANTNGAILKLLKSLGCGAEIVSEGELRRCLNAGFDPSTIISTSFGKLPSEIKACLEAGIHQLNVESPEELQTIDRIAAEIGKTAKVVFRLNPNVTGGGHSKITTGRKRDKFGMSAERIVEIYAQAEKLDHIDPVGLSVHIGSQVMNVEAFRPAFEIFADLVKTLRGKGHKVERLDIGGGFPIQYHNEDLLDLSSYAGWVADYILPLDTEIQMEPGRYLTGNSGALLTETIYIKQTDDQDFLVVDAGMNDLIRPTLYEAYHHMSPVQNHERPEKSYDVVGPVCESGDTFTKGRILPEMQAGDHLLIETAGAYGFVMASNYNSRELPPEILVDGDKVAVIRQRQSFEQMIAGESIPDWL